MTKPNHLESIGFAEKPAEHVNYVQVGPGGLCFAHGPYAEGQNCPRWPACITDPRVDEYVQMGLAQVAIPKLERAVIEAAGSWYRWHARPGRHNAAELHTREQLLLDAVDALLKARESE